MTLMTDDIEWYPLPEVEEDDDAEGKQTSCMSNRTLPPVVS